MFSKSIKKKNKNFLSFVNLWCIYITVDHTTNTTIQKGRYMSTHNTHYVTSKRFASAFPVPDYWCRSENLKTITVFRCHDDNNSVFDVTICFLDGFYFFYFTFGLRPDNSIYYITSCSFVSLKNCLFGFRSTAKSLRWYVEDIVNRIKFKEVK